MISSGNFGWGRGGGVSQSVYYAQKKKKRKEETYITTNFNRIHSPHKAIDPLPFRHPRLLRLPQGYHALKDGRCTVFNLLRVVSQVYCVLTVGAAFLDEFLFFFFFFLFGKFFFVFSSFFFLFSHSLAAVGRLSTPYTPGGSGTGPV